MVVILSPVLDDLSGFLHAGELLARKTFVSQATVEAFDVTVLPRAAWLDVGSPDINLRKEIANTARDELWPVVATNELWNAADRQQVREQFNELITCKPPTYFHGQTLSCVFIDDDKDLQRATVCRAVENEIDRPNMVLMFSLAADDSTKR